MDKETAVTLAQVKAAVEDQGKRLKDIEDDFKQWNSLLKKAILKIITWLVIAGGTGLFFGWKMPPEVRKALIDWATK